MLSCLLQGGFFHELQVGAPAGLLCHCQLREEKVSPFQTL